MYSVWPVQPAIAAPLCHLYLRVVCPCVAIRRDQDPQTKDAFLMSTLYPYHDHFWRQVSCATHLAAVPGLGLSTAAAGNVIVLSLDLGNDAVHVEVPAVVHLDDDRRV